MPDLRTHLNQRYRRLSAVWLKNAAAVIMLIVAAGRIIIQLGLIRLDTYTGETLSAAMDADPNLMTLSGVASIIPTAEKSSAPSGARWKTAPFISGG